jgi:diguanylate cyclase (GGDEF)-like protein
MSDGFPDEDLVALVDDEPGPPIQPTARPWHILIVDDDEQVHTSTVFALSGQMILGCGLAFLHAYTAAEARRILLTESDVAVILLDVVMEAEDSGLKLVRAIREDLGLSELRIILRTGQPGYAPEIEAIRDYDINDYRTKEELTRTRLLTSLTTAIRSYEQIRMIAYGRRGLEKIVRAAADLFEKRALESLAEGVLTQIAGAAADLFEKRALESLAEGVLTQIAGLLDFPPNGVVCAQRGFPLDGTDREHLYVVGAVGRFASVINRPLDALGDPRIEAAIREGMARQQNIYAPDHTLLYLKSQGGTEETVFLDSVKPLNLLDRQLLEVFASNISVGFSNVYLFHRLNYLAYHDPLTDLPNRQKLADLIDTAWRVGRNRCSVYLVDIDHFSDINDVLGASLGDQILCAVARRMRHRLPETVQIGRYGGDVLCVVTTPERVSPETIQELFRDPFEVSGYQLPISVTLGGCTGEAVNESLDLLKNAGLALTHAKRTRRGQYVRFTKQMQEASQQRLDLVHALRRTVEKQGLELNYQPQMDLVSGRIVGAEALLRWQRDTGQTVPPGVFIPLAERSGLIPEIGAWVMAEACRQLARWQEEGLGL